MAKRIEIWERPLGPRRSSHRFVNWNLEEYITACTLDGSGGLLSIEEGRMTAEEIDRLHNLPVFSTMLLFPVVSPGDPEVGLTIRRIPDSPMSSEEERLRRVDSGSMRLPENRRKRQIEYLAGEIMCCEQRLKSLLDAQKRVLSEAEEES